MGDVHLVGFVIAGQRVHHEIDAAAQRQFALARAARAELCAEIRLRGASGL